MLGGQHVVLCVGVILNDPAHNHVAQPLAHITLLQPRSLRDVATSGRGKRRHYLKQARAVSDAQHENRGTVIQGREHPIRERVGSLLVDRIGNHIGSPCSSSW